MGYIAGQDIGSNMLMRQINRWSYFEELKLGALIVAYLCYQLYTNQHAMVQPEEQRVILFRTFEVTEWANGVALFFATIITAIANMLPCLDTITQQGDTLYSTSITFPVQITYGCLAVRHHQLFTIMMIIAGGAWIAKLRYILLGNVVLALFNIVRILSLIYIAQYAPAQMPWFHDFYLSYAHFGMVVVLWLCWRYHFNKTTQCKEES